MPNLLKTSSQSQPRIETATCAGAVATATAYTAKAVQILPEHKLLIKNINRFETFIVMCGSGWYESCFRSRNLKTTSRGDAPNQPSNSVFPMRQFSQTKTVKRAFNPKWLSYYQS